MYGLFFLKKKIRSNAASSADLIELDSDRNLALEMFSIWKEGLEGEALFMNMICDADESPQ